MMLLRIQGAGKRLSSSYSKSTSFVLFKLFKGPEMDGKLLNSYEQQITIITNQSVSCLNG